MLHNAPSPGKAFWAAPLPYVVALVVTPLAVLAGRLAGRPWLGETLGPHGMAPWLALAGFAVLAALAARAKADKPKWPLAAAGGILAALAWVLARALTQILAQAEDLAPLFDELRLPALVCFALLWAWSFGAPRRESLARAAAVLGALVTLDFLLTAIMARGVVPGGGYLFGETPGMADLLATLLCVGLAATTADAPAPGTPRLARWLILAGLFASGSRAGMAAGAAVCIFAETGPLTKRLGMALALLLALYAGLVLPLQRPAGDDLGLDWYYAATFQAVGQDARALWGGLPLDEPVALAMPELQGFSFDGESEGLPVSACQIPVSWLRLLAGWGLCGVLAVFFAAGVCLRRGRNRFGAALAIVLGIGGALAPVLHAPATAATLALAFIAAARRAPAPDAQAPQSGDGI
jgi:hypothetical protein